MDLARIEAAVREILLAVGEDPTREGLQETPARVARMYSEVFASLGKQAEEVANYKTFHVEERPEMVLVQDIPFYSMCEHHLLPFFGVISLAYVPNDRVIGLSKIPRLVDYVTKKPGMQERVTTELLAELDRLLAPAGVAVVVVARGQRQRHGQGPSPILQLFVPVHKWFCFLKIDTKSQFVRASRHRVALDDAVLLVAQILHIGP